ncbi:MAG TPA: hypothetical protein VLC28_07270 [Flavitalea sp.]|nr:hypothetical protein [Flavitalea sp.]
MKTNIEDFIRSHREEMDHEIPPEKIWSSIENQMFPATVISIRSKRKKLILQFSAAASLLIIFVTAWMLITRHEQPKVVVASGGNKIIEEIDPNYAAQVKEFTKTIEVKQLELKKIQAEQPGLYREFSQDIERLDSSYNTLKTQLPKNPNREQLLEAMIRNLQLQTELLSQQLQIIQKIRNTKTGKNENSFKTI